MLFSVILVVTLKNLESSASPLKLLVPDSCLSPLLLKPLLSIPSVLRLFLFVVTHTLVFSVRILYFAYLTVHMQ